jgi:uncharacterized protein
VKKRGTYLTPEEQFWEYVANNNLRFQRCTNCGTWRYPTAEVCHSCLGSNADWIEVTGRGTLLSYIVVRGGQLPPESYPYCVAHAELDEGVRYTAMMLDQPMDSVTVGMPLQLVLRSSEDHGVLPQFVRLSSR